LLLLILTALLIFCAAASQAAPIRTVTTTITKITDGDTVQAVTPEGTKLKVRLYGIDVPETAKGKIVGALPGNALLERPAAHAEDDGQELGVGEPSCAVREEPLAGPLLGGPALDRLGAKGTFRALRRGRPFPGGSFFIQARSHFSL